MYTVQKSNNQGGFIPGMQMSFYIYSFNKYLGGYGEKS